MQTATTHSVSSVYGPVKSWRFGRSLGIDPIGTVSTCSFNCVYCQLGEIQHQQCDRQVFISTHRIQQDLLSFAPWDVDVITLSGSGEPTLALNLGEILTMTKYLTAKPVGVLTNGSLLNQAAVRAELAIADQVSIKLDAISTDQLRRVNRPAAQVNLPEIWTGLYLFRQEYRGHLSVQTMLLAPWDEALQTRYIRWMQTLLPDEIQLNTPTRPKPLTHQINARGNHTPEQSYPTRSLKTVDAEVLKQFGDRIESTIGIPVRYPLRKSH
ncbi:radical SAM protein [Oscillatoria sp. FACHB-1407]|uniref:radical SAM protein n=1 Tax=Oscillatoria sp. FACHB-1407 TaxID=2692847 RepID=UPI0016854722|nr:radical SAM protein [Oscillatoria sp. FACHB-1407]MBD2459504.1 radical SAM protein [Oscillatoria sp. FACHB-1407]